MSVSDTTVSKYVVFYTDRFDRNVSEQIVTFFNEEPSSQNCSFCCFGVYLYSLRGILPVIGCLRSGKLLKDVTLLLSIDRSTDGNGAVVPSECDLSCTARAGKHVIGLLLPQVVLV